MLSSFYLHQKYLLLISLLSFAAYSQMPSVKADLPNISPASPTAAALMKFEEVPVDNYTGVPNISIPLYTTETLSKDISMNIALNYHPASIMIHETAAYTGLGWNLMAGGTVTRTVRGFPDEVKISASTSVSPKRIGIYHNSDSDLTIPNYYYDRINYPNLTSPNQQQTDNVQEFGFGAFEKGYFDTEHDLYQYNFMGHTGRFYIKKITLANDLDGSVGTYVIVKLDNDNNIKITLKTATSPSTNFDGFIFYDDKGYQYNFEIPETTTETISSISKPFSRDGLAPIDIGDSPSTLNYRSSWQLTSITDRNAQQLVSISYQDATEAITNVTSEFNFSSMLNGTSGGAIGVAQDSQSSCTVVGLLPKQAMMTKTSSTVTKKPNEINIINKAKIAFTLVADREDNNINAGAKRLSAMTVKNNYGQLIKQYSFDYDYATLHQNGEDSDTDIHRLILTSVTETGVGTTEQLHHNLSYKNQNVTANKIEQDFWGYYKRKSTSMETDPESCMTGVLESMTMPTGGTTFFTWGPNTYSYIGSTPLTDFTRDDYNSNDVIVPQDPDLTHGNTGLGHWSPSFSEASRIAYFTPDSNGIDGRFTLTQAGSSDINIDAAGFTGMNDGTASRGGIKVNKNAQYSIRFTPSNPNIVISNVTVGVKWNGPIASTGELWQYGGGIRIDKISYYDGVASTPVKEKLYNYNFFSTPNRSSGSLVFAKPVFNYPRSKTCYYASIGCGSQGPRSAYYDTYTSFNNLLSLRTRGSDVGYKNVKVWETGNGKSEYTYTTPIDYPENSYSLQIPAVATFNYDYKRGLLTNEKHYKQVTTNTYLTLNEKIYGYPVASMDPQLVITGVRSNQSNINFGASTFETYADYASCASNPGCLNGTIHPTLIYYTDYFVYEAYGWPKLLSKTNKDYFYPSGSTTPNIKSNTESYTYNTTNKKISTLTSSSSVGESLKTEFTYDTNDASHNRIGQIKSITSKRDNIVLDKKDITYSNSEWGTVNTSYLPKTISRSKGTNVLESRLQFTKYDIYSNPIEAKEENGTPVCYIWGYNKSQPIAIIKNMAYSDITQTLITEAQTASDATPNPATETNFATKETTVLAKLAALRDSLPSTAMMTSYTYLKPLIGPTTIIDERGSKSTYVYDGFGRLVQTKDNQGKITAENKYNYRPQ